MNTAKRLQSVEGRLSIIKRGFERLMAQFKVRMHLGYGVNSPRVRHIHLCAQRCVFADISKYSKTFYGLQSLGQNLAFIHGSLNQLMPCRQIIAVYFWEYKPGLRSVWKTQSSLTLKPLIHCALKDSGSSVNGALWKCYWREVKHKIDFRIAACS